MISQLFRLKILLCAGLILLLFGIDTAPVQAAETQEELTKKSLNPVADLISLPFQYNQDYGIGTGSTNAMKTVLNIQPVVPVHLNKDWIVIIRTILPVIDMESPAPGVSEASGFGDITQSFFFAPKALVHGWITGVGPVLYYPTASHDQLGTGKWGIGPTFVVLKQEHGFTYGMLANHISSFAGDSSRPEISSTFLQPFFTYTTKTYTSFSVNTESTYDWKTSQWTVPFNFFVTQMLKIKNQPLSLQLGWRWYAETATGGPGNGIRFALTFLFPE